jgi:ABC-type Zn uptake system ZnuABC Zn-binding protein ZnuA
MDGSMVSIMVKTLLLVALMTVAMAASACGDSNPASSKTAIDVVTTSNIAEDWVQRIGGERVEVFSLVPPGADPHAFQPGARDVTRVADADVVFSMGLGLEEEWLKDLVSTAAANTGAVIALGESADPIIAGGQDTGIPDPHFWFDPLRVKLAIAEIGLTLTALDPAGAQEYRDNSITYLQELDDLHLRAQQIVTELPADRRRLVTSHDSLAYFALRYGFEVIGTVVPGVATDGEPSAREMADLIDLVKKHAIPAIFVENTTSDRLANRVAEEAGITIVRSLYTGSLSAAGKGADTYIDMMRANISAIVEALQ